MPSQHDKILFVDDEELLLSALRRRLSDSFNILTETSAARAIDMIERRDDIAVIVADMQMPEMSGIDLLKAVQQRAPTVRRIMLTGNSDLETAIAAINDGKVMRFLRKPCDAEVLKSTLLQALSEYEFQTSAPAEVAPAKPAPDSGETARATFLSLMNHELRTPLNQIIGLAGIIETDPPSSMRPESLAHLEQIQECGREMLRLISRILDFSRLRSNPGAEEAEETVDIIELLNDEIRKATRFAKSKDVTIALDSLRRRAEIRANATDLRIAVRELLENAIKFNSAQGHVSVLVRCDRESVAIKIVDTGCGLAPSQMERILQPFRQGDESLTRPFGGIGLGLALVTTIAELNGANFSLGRSVSGGAEATLVFSKLAPKGAQDFPPAKDAAA